MFFHTLSPSSPKNFHLLLRILDFLFLTITHTRNITSASKTHKGMLIMLKYAVSGDFSKYIFSLGRLMYVFIMSDMWLCQELMFLSTVRNFISDETAPFRALHF